MGVSNGKQTQVQSLSFLHDFAATSGMPIGEVMGHFKDWKKKNPTGVMGKKCFFDYMGRAFPAFSQQELLSIGEHVFRVFDTNGDGRIDFMEFMVVYNIMTWKEPKVILSKIFDIFDVDKDNKISKLEMERVLTDLAGLFKDKRSA